MSNHAEASVITKERESEARLRRHVEEELEFEPSVDAVAIGVAVEDGTITLSGQVASLSEKIAAEHAAARVHGVTSVISELKVAVPTAGRPSDEEITRAAAQALAWNALVPPGRITIQVEDGRITLEGDVDWRYQQVAAYDAVRHLKGVQGISDKVVVKPVTVSASVKAHIEAALRRSFGPDGRHVVVETRGDHVTLRGTVRSLAERAEVERAAWTTPGVCHVNNNLAVVNSRLRSPRVRF